MKNIHFFPTIVKLKIQFNNMIAFTGPKIAMLVASGSFVAIAGIVMTISKVSPKTLQKAHYTKMDIYGHMSYFSSFDMSSYWKIFGKTKIKDQKFTCQLSGKSFTCSIEKENIPTTTTKDQACKTTMTTDQENSIYKITVPIDEMPDWQNNKTIKAQIQGREKSTENAGLYLEPFFSVYGKEKNCIPPYSK